MSIRVRFGALSWSYFYQNTPSEADVSDLSFFEVLSKTESFNLFTVRHPFYDLWQDKIAVFDVFWSPLDYVLSKDMFFRPL